MNPDVFFRVVNPPVHEHTQCWCGDTGSCRLGAGTRLDSVPDALTAEAMAAKEGLELAAECGFDKAVLEVDCSELKS